MYQQLDGLQLVSLPSVLDNLNPEFYGPQLVRLPGLIDLVFVVVGVLVVGCLIDAAAKLYELVQRQRASLRGPRK